MIQCAWDDSDYSSKKWLLFHLIKMVSDHGGRSYTTIDCNLRISRSITDFIHEALKNGIVEEGISMMEDKFLFIVDEYLSKYSTVPMAYIFFIMTFLICTVKIILLLMLRNVVSLMKY